MSNPAAGKSIRIVLVDDHEVVRTGMNLIIQKQPQMTVVAEASNAGEAMEVVREEQPDIILLDLDLGDEQGLENGLHCISQLLEVASAARIIVLTGSRDEETHRRAIGLGAMGILGKESATELIVKAITRVFEGEAWIDPKLTATLLAEFSGAKKSKKEDRETLKIASLSKRETEVVKLVGDGLKSKEIAERLFISEITVRHHLTSIFAKLEVSDRVELMLYAYKHGLAKAPA
jgi:DNA-binding NarL/FixJ family response regulator